MESLNPETAWTPVRLGLKSYRCEWQVSDSGSIFLGSATHQGIAANSLQRERLFIRGLMHKPGRALLDRVLDEPQRADFWRRQARIKRLVSIATGALIFAALIAISELRHPLWHRLGFELGDAAWIGAMAAAIFLSVRIRAVALSALRIKL